MSILFYLLLTIVIEGIALALLMRGWYTKEQTVLLLANAVSWPILQILWRNGGINIWFLECMVTMFEAIILFLVAQVSLRKALLYSFLTNAVSLGIGILIYGLPQ